MVEQGLEEGAVDDEEARRCVNRAGDEWNPVSRVGRGVALDDVTARRWCGSVGGGLGAASSVGGGGGCGRRQVAAESRAGKGMERAEERRHGLHDHDASLQSHGWPLGSS